MYFNLSTLWTWLCHNLGPGKHSLSWCFCSCSYQSQQLCIYKLSTVILSIPLYFNLPPHAFSGLFVSASSVQLISGNLIFSEIAESAISKWPINFSKTIDYVLEVPIETTAIDWSELFKCCDILMLLLNGSRLSKILNKNVYIWFYILALV